MTYKTVGRNVHFKDQTGSSSVRVTQRGYGGTSLKGDPVAIIPTVREQFVIIGDRIKELEELIASASTFEQAERLRKEMHSKTEEWGKLRKIIYQGCLLAKETIFWSVAKHRLPEELYALVLHETNDLWESKGYPEMMPELTSKQRNRAQRKLVYNNWKHGRG